MLTLEAHLRSLHPDGRAFLAGTQGTFWVRYERWSMLRTPVFALHTPTSAEIHRVLWRALVISYLQEPTITRPTNAVVYLCRDHTYTLEKLSSSMRRNVRRGMATLRILPLSTEEVLQHGYSAYADTRLRAGLGDGDRHSFEERFMQRSHSPANTYLGAWLNKRLIAFLSITEVESWVEFESLFSCTDTLEYRPNDTLIYYALRYYLIESPREIISYGVSSVQSQAEEGLHRFKLKVGFEAQEVHRSFIVHPALRPFVNRLGLAGLQKLLAHFPRSRVLRKAEGVFNNLIDRSADRSRRYG